MEDLVLVPIALVLAELTAQLWWSRRYWPLGIPLFRASRKIGFGANALPAVADLQLNFAGTFVPSLVFRRFDEHLLAFRESLQPRFLVFNYLPVMRGTVRFHPMNSSIEVSGYGNWWFPVAATMSTGLAGARIGALAFLAVLFCILYVIQAVRFRSVAVEVAEMMNVELAAANRMRALKPGT